MFFIIIVLKNRRVPNGSHGVKGQKIKQEENCSIFLLFYFSVQTKII
jgi:hypothetical protein